MKRSEKQAAKRMAAASWRSEGMSWESPLGPTTIDPETRDVISNIYLRMVERVNGELWNIEFATVENFKDPVKAAKE